MKLPSAVFLTLTFLPLSLHAVPDRAEALKIVQGVNRRVEALDVKAFDALEPLGTDEKMAAYILFFKNTFYRYKAPPEFKVLAAKALKALTETPGAEDWYKALWKKPPGERGGIGFQRQTAIDALAEANNRFAIRVMCEALSEPDLGEQAVRVLRGFLKMDIPSPPYPKTPYPAKEPSGSTNREGLAKWKAWWEQHKDEYPADKDFPAPKS